MPFYNRNSRTVYIGGVIPYEYLVNSLSLDQFFNLIADSWVDKVKDPESKLRTNIIHALFAVHNAFVYLPVGAPLEHFILSNDAFNNLKNVLFSENGAALRFKRDKVTNYDHVLVAVFLLGSIDSPLLGNALTFSTDELISLYESNLQ